MSHLKLRVVARALVSCLVLAVALAASPAPTAASDPEPPVAALGGACDVRSDGRVSCGPAGDDNSPVRGAGIPDHLLPSELSSQRTWVHTIDDAAQVDGQHYAACAVRSSGAVACWGRGQYSRVLRYAGAGDIAAPAVVPGLPKISRVAVGNHACAVGAGGAVLCWGADEAGEASGTPRPGSIAALPAREQLTPAQVPGLPAAVDVAVGNQFSCAVSVAGKIWCWGVNGYEGRLGLGAELSTDAVLAPTQVPGVDGATAISLGPTNGCAIAQGDVWCWGLPAWRAPELTWPQRNARAFAVPTKVAGVSEAVQISVGLSSSCARTAHGTVHCWGDNSLGQLGALGRRSTAAVQVRQLDDAIDLTARAEQNCVLRRSGAVACWGPSASVQAEDPAVRRTSTSTPVTAHGVSDAVELATARRAWCVRRAAGEVRCTGFDVAGPQETASEFDGSGAAPAPSTALVGVTQMVSGDSGICFLTSAGRVHCSERSIREPIDTFNTGGAGPLTGVTQISHGRGHACARTDDARVWCWGEQNAGQVLYSPRPGTLDSAGRRSTVGVEQVIATGDRSCALLVGGSVVCWGAQSSPSGGDSSADTPVELPAPATGLTVVAHRTCATFSDRPIACWGPSLAPEDGDVACSLSGGQVLCTGDGSGGLLGVGSDRFTYWRSVPTAQRTLAVRVPLPAPTPVPDPAAPDPAPPILTPLDRTAVPQVLAPAQQQARPARLRVARSTRSATRVVLTLIFDSGDRACGGVARARLTLAGRTTRATGRLRGSRARCVATIRLKLPARSRSTARVRWSGLGIADTVAAKR